MVETSSSKWPKEPWSNSRNETKLGSKRGSRSRSNSVLTKSRWITPTSLRKKPRVKSLRMKMWKVRAWNTNWMKTLNKCKAI